MPSVTSPWATPSLHHDLVETLHVTKASLALLASRHGANLSDGAGKLLKIARESIDAASVLLETARSPKAAPTPLTRPVVNASPILLDVVEFVQTRFPHVRIEPSTIPLVRADDIDLRRVFQNLLCNAAKHAGAAPRIRVAAQGDGDEVHISVVDDGPGIDPRDHLSLFRHSPRSDGHGRGLPNVLDLVHEMGGRLWIESSPGNGVAVHFTLPRG